jgi:hypothetical protein
LALALPTTTERPTVPTTGATVPSAIAVATSTTLVTTTTLAPTSTTAAPVTTGPQVGNPALPPLPPPTAGVQLGQQPTTTTAPQDEDVVLGELSTDPADWPQVVIDHLASTGLDAAADGASPHDGPGSLITDEGCAVQCITSGLAYAVGTGAYLEVTTSVPAFIQIEVLDVGLKFGPPSASEWGDTWPHLDPDTTYHAIARAHDANGNMAVASGEFTTHIRSASITFEPTVFWFGNVPDFDPWQNYDWQNNAYAYLNGDLQVAAHHSPAPTLEFQTGAIDPSVIDVVYVGEYHCNLGCEDVSFWTLFVDNIFGAPAQQAAPFGAGPPDHSGGVYGNTFYGAIGASIQLDGYPDDATTWTGHEFTFALSTFWGDSVGPPVYLTVDVTVEVSYS